MSIILSVYSEAGEWTVQSVLGGNDLTSENYQEKYQSLHKTRTWWKDQLTDYPTEKEIQIQRYIQLLHQELQVSHQTKVSLQEALVEANKQGIYTNTLTDNYMTLLLVYSVFVLILVYIMNYTLVSTSNLSLYIT